jgi:hypothetical protein
VAQALGNVAEVVDRIRMPIAVSMLKIRPGFSSATKWRVPRLDPSCDNIQTWTCRSAPMIFLSTCVRGIELTISFYSGVHSGMRVDQLFEEQDFPARSLKLIEGPLPCTFPRTCTILS